MKKILLLVPVLLLGACSHQPTISPSSNHRLPSGVGDIGSSTDQKTVAPLNTYKLPITREGKTITRVAVNSWGGEYPKPIIDVNSRIAGTTKIKGYASLRTLGKPVSCTIKNGIYHPWSQTTSSVINFYSIYNELDYRAKKDTTLGEYEKVSIPQGTPVINVVAYGANFCGATSVIDKKSTAISFSCEDLDNTDLFEKTSQSEFFEEQWLYVACAEKETDGSQRKVFIRDMELFKYPHVKQGEYGPQYGKVESRD
ncbi:MAG: hypothetical protein AAGB31_12010 [Bdellovibrio sp.]